MKNLNQFMYGSVGVLVGSGLFFGGVVASGVTTGLFSTLGVGMILLKLRQSCPRVWRWIVKHNVMSDLILSALLAYIVGSGTATGIIAGAASALFCSVGITLLDKLNRP